MKRKRATSDSSVIAKFEDSLVKAEKFAVSLRKKNKESKLKGLRAKRTIEIQLRDSPSKGTMFVDEGGVRSLMIDIIAR